MGSPTGSSLSRRGLLTAAALGATGRGAATTSSPTTVSQDAPSVRWTFEPSDVDFVYPVTVSGGTAYAVTRSDPSNSSGDSDWRTSLHAFDVESGEEEWNRTFGDYASFHETGDGLVYAVGTERNDDQAASTLYAFDGESGLVEWKKSRNRTAESAPRLVDDELYVSWDRSLVAYDPTSGERRWTFDGVENLITSALSSFPIHTDETLFLSDRGSIVAVDRSDGTERWRETLSGTTRRPVSTDGERVLVWGEHGVVALGVADGSRRWELDLQSDGHWFPGTVHDGTMYVWGAGLYAVDVASGDEQWRFETSTGRREGGLSPHVADGTVYAPTREGSLYAVDAANGDEQWSFEKDGTMNPLWGETMGGSVYVAVGNGVYALDARSGDRQWRFAPSAAETTTDRSADERRRASRKMVWSEATDELVFAGANDGSLYAIERQRSLLAAAMDDASEFLGSGPGMALAGVLGGAGVLAAYRRLDAADRTAGGAVDPDDSDPEYGTLELLRTGPATETYRVRERTGDGPRVVAETRLTDPDRADAFRAAVERWAAMDDRPGVLAVLDRGDDPEPWVRTPAFRRSLADAGDVRVAERVDAVSAANVAVHRAHGDGVVHGGLSPATVLFDDPTDAVVGDWELAAALERSEASAYAAPEQVAGEDADAKTDQYRLAATAYYALTGEAPSAGTDGEWTPPSDRDPSLPPELDDVLATAMADDPGDRYESVVKFDDALRWAAFRV
ncbi:hypothetical protein DMJ13_04305 [halophilic archaeon]|nr:hypothetical protein DMJ13_04305 [halophilic archaeon]